MGAKEVMVAGLSGGQHVGEVPGRNPGVVDQQVQLFVTRLEMRHQRFAIGRGADVALNGLCAGFGSQGLRGLMISAIRRYHSVSFRKLDRNSAPDAATGTGNQRDRSILLRQVRLRWPWPRLRM